MDAHPQKKILIAASGTGSNADVLMQCFTEHPEIGVSAVVCNKANAGVISKAHERGVPVWLFGKKNELEPENWFQLLRCFQPDLIVLAGWLKAIPVEIVNAYPSRILNIHPALLPKYGGVGMYGMRVHEAVVHHGEEESGFTAHWVTEEYDEGPIVKQHKLNVHPNWTAEHLQTAVQALEHRYFPEIVEQQCLLLKPLSILTTP